MKSKFHLWALLICISICQSTFVLMAQEDCTEKLYNANTLYEKGQLGEAIQIAKTCAEKSNSTSIQWQANRLLAMAYAANNQIPEARRAAEKMLELNPSYKPSYLTDPSDLIQLLKKVKVIPRFSIGLAVSLGMNSSIPNVLTTYNGAIYTKNYNYKNSWQTAIYSGFHMNEIISIHSGIIASSKKYKIDYALEDWQIKVDESLTYLDVPLFARFTTLQKNRFRYFADVGFYGGRLLGAKSDFSAYSSTTGTTIETSNLNAISRRNLYEFGLLAGMGVMYKIGDLNISLDCRYFRSYTNIFPSEKRYDNKDLLYKYYFLDDDLRLNNISISLNFLYTIRHKVLRTN